MVRLEILRDNREQKPWEFEDFDVTIEDVTISTGDYTVVELCEHDPEHDTYHPTYAVERKSGQDFVQSITQHRERFQEEVKRASDWECPLLVLIETPKTTIRRQRGFMRFLDVSQNAIFGTIEKWERYYNVEFKFTGSRERAQQQAFDTLSSRLRSILMSGD